MILMTAVEDRVLDRIPRFDERSLNYPVRATLLSSARTDRVSRTWKSGPVLDQGTEGACVGFSWTAELMAIPAIVEGSEDSARSLYKQAQTLDDWPGEDYEGSSVLGGAQALKKNGYLPEYRWALSTEELLLAVGHLGPAVIGINWYEPMFNPDEHGLVRVEGNVAGGHAIMVRGVRVHPPFCDEPVFRLRNSWGPDWGVGGDCYVRYSDMERLLHEQGEACVPVRRLRVPQPETS